MLEYLLREPPDLLGFVLVAVVLVIALTLHEFAHAAAGTWQGDPTARLAGRLTLNPLAHLDLVGSIMLILIGFGFGKPVPFTPSKLRNRRFGSAFVAAAGPATNILLAILSAFGLGLLTSPSSNLAGRFLQVSLYLNVLLAIFNLIPIPPLDGSRILSAALPPSRQHIMYFLDQWSFPLLILVAFVLFRLPIFGRLISFVIGVIFRLAT